jgi:hypothetical protein
MAPTSKIDCCAREENRDQKVSPVVRSSIWKLRRGAAQAAEPQTLKIAVLEALSGPQQGRFQPMTQAMRGHKPTSSNAMLPDHCF